MKRLEEYILDYACKLYTIRMYTDGEYRCSCNKYKKQFSPCIHILKVKYNEGRIIGAKRFK